MKKEAPIKVLIADDNRVNLDLTREILESAGYAVDTAENGREAADAFARKRHPLVLLDAEMPVMGGMEAIRAIRGMEAENASAGLAGTTAVCITAHPGTGFCERALRAGFDHCIKKPVDYSDLLTKLAEWTRMNQGCRRAEASLTRNGEGSPSAFDLPGTLARFDNDRELLGRLVSNFLESSEKQVSAMERACEAGNLDAVMREAHSIRGAAVTLAAGRLSAAAAVIERAASEGRKGAIPELIPELKQSLAAFGENVRSLYLIVDEK